MSAYYDQLLDSLQSILDQRIIDSRVALGELTLVVDSSDVIETAKILRDHEQLQFDNLIDVCGVDYSAYEGKQQHSSRYASVYHLQSIVLNHRIRLKCYLDEHVPVIDSVTSVWSAANWFEREAFDLLGILYNGHPDLRRILTDYGFIGHPLRKDFPMVGNVEMRYDHEKKRVVYEPVSIENRVITPRTLQQDHRYEHLLKDSD